MKLKIAKSNLTRILATILGQALMWFALYLIAVQLTRNWQQIAPTLVVMQIGPLIGALFLTLAMLMLMPLGWKYALHATGISMSFRSAFILYYQTSILRYLPGSLWYLPGRAFLSQKQGISLSAFTQSALLELFFLLTCGAIFAAWGLASYLGEPRILLASVIAAGTIIFTVLWPNRAFSLLWRKPSVSNSINRSISTRMSLTYLAMWLTYGGSIDLLLRALLGDQVPNSINVISLSIAAWTVGFLSPAPTGLGVRELSLSLVLGSSIGTAAVVASLTQRIMELFLEGVLWLSARLMSPSPPQESHLLPK